jgi:xanthine/uracil permease
MLLVGRDLVHACRAMLQLLVHSRILIATLVAFALNAFFDDMDATAHETANAVLASGHL